MSNDEKNKSALIAAGHNPAFVDRTIEAAEGLRSILNDIPTPPNDSLPNDSLKDVFEEEA